MQPTPRTAFRRHLPILLLTGLFSAAINLLMLTGPLFMLQVYDRVLASRSEPTLVALSILMAGMFAAMAVLDIVRVRIGVRVGAAFQADLDPHVFRAATNAPPAARSEAATALGDLEAVRRFLTSALFFAFFDLPFSPLFLLALYLFHPSLGVFATLSALLLVILMLMNQALSRHPADAAGKAAARATRTAEAARTRAETIRGLGMAKSVAALWRTDRNASLAAEVSLSDRNGTVGGLVKTLRLFIQSAMLALGAWLVVREELTAGAIVASSVMLGRAMAPVEQLVGGWATVARAARGWLSLGRLMSMSGAETPLTRLPVPRAVLAATDLTVVPPGAARPSLSRATFVLRGGQALGVMGESASGKSSLARALAGVWRPFAGEVSLGGARLDQYDAEDLAGYIGYLPQDVVLFDGTVAANIARLAADADPVAITRAGQLAGAHEMILSLPRGYDTEVGEGGTALSGGQRQRIGLARALYGDPILLVLDEPNSSLDAAGTEAMNAAIRAQKAAGRMAVIMAHRPAALGECDHLLLLRGGQVQAFGPRDEVLRTTGTAGPRIVWTSRRREEGAA